MHSVAVKSPQEVYSYHYHILQTKNVVLTNTEADLRITAGVRVPSFTLEFLNCHRLNNEKYGGKRLK